MAYVYESIQSGLFNFTIPGKDKTVKLFKGSKVTVDNKLSGGYLRVLRFVEEVQETPAVTKPKAKVEDKITNVGESVEPVLDTVDVRVGDTIINTTKPAVEVKGEDKSATPPKAAAPKTTPKPKGTPIAAAKKPKVSNKK